MPFFSFLGCHSDANTERFPCEACGKSFAVKSDMQTHFSRVHLQKEKPFPCDLCSKGFAKFTNLNSHIMKEHTDNKPIDLSPPECKLCGKTFSTEKIFKVHMKNVHKQARAAVTSGKDFEFL